MESGESSQVLATDFKYFDIFFNSVIFTPALPLRNASISDLGISARPVLLGFQGMQQWALELTWQRKINRYAYMFKTIILYNHHDGHHQRQH